MDVIPIYLDEEAERGNIRRTVDLIVRATGKRPTGWISPRGTPSPRTGRLLAEEGFEWHGDSLNDDLPYFVHFKAGTVVSFSSNMECNDLPLYMRHGNPPPRDAGNIRGLARLCAPLRAGRRPHRSDHPFACVRPPVAWQCSRR